MNASAPGRGRLIANLTLGAVALWVLIGFLTWHGLTSGVRLGIPRVDNDNGQHLLFDGVAQGLAVVGVLLLHICAAILGYALVIRPIWGGRRLASELWLILAGVVPGTLMLIPLARVLTLLLPNSIAPAAEGVIVLAATVLASLSLARQWRRDGFTLSRADIGLAALLFAGAAVFSVEIDRFHIVGEAAVWFVNQVYLSPAFGIGAGHLPLISQHYDEAALLYPAIYGLMRLGPGDLATFSTLYWIMVIFGRVGLCSLVYISLRSLGLDRLSAVISLIFVCLASLSINAISSVLLFDSLNPLIFALHMARFLIPVAPLVLVAVLLALQGRPGASPLDTRFKAAAALAAVLGLGLSAMPIHAVLVLGWALPVVAITQVAPDAANSPRLWRAASLAGLIVVASLAVVFALAYRLPATISVAILALGAVTAAALVTLAWFTSGAAFQPRALLSRPVLLVLAMCVGYGLGLLLLGNIFITKTQPLLSHVWPWSGMSSAARPVADLAGSSGKLMLQPYCAGYQWGFRTLAGNCSSLPMLVRSYGLAIAAMAGVIAWWTRTPPTPSLASDRQRTMILCGLVLCLLAMPLSFIDFDFIAPADAPIDWQRQLSIWLRTRLIEPWFYSGILLSLVLFLRDAGARSRRWTQSAMLAASAIGGLTPLVLPGQLIVNFSFLFGAMMR